MKHGIAFIPISYCRGLGWEGRKCPPLLTVFTDMPADYKLGEGAGFIAPSCPCKLVKEKGRETAKLTCTAIFFFSSLLPSCMTPSHSLPASTSKSKVDFICPIMSQLQSLSSSCHSVLCGSDNGSNYTGSMSVPHYSIKDRLWQHDAHCWLATFSMHSGEAQEKGLRAVAGRRRQWGNGVGLDLWKDQTKYAKRW